MAVSKDFKSKINKAINNQNIRFAMENFGDAYPASREKAYNGVDIDALYEKISEGKRRAAQNMDTLREKFTKEAEKRGAVVHFAKTGDEAKEIIAKIAEKENVKSMVKSKSMASEEIHLNDYLKKKGIEVNETDLGEWIIQIMEEPPTHMVMPAIHLSKEQVAKTFSEHLGREIPAEIPELTQTAREVLRDRFLNADMGLSGANCAVAENGSIVIMTNEGNGRMTALLPRVHVALVGLEKLVPDMDLANTIMEALPRSGTGQTISSYIQFIDGQTTAWNGEKVEDKKFHIVLMDNGRSELAKDPIFSQALQCIRCGSCLNVCPIFHLVSGHVYGHIYTGGIGTILTAFFNSEDKAIDPQNLCISCQKCTTVCPGKIEIPKLVKELRLKLTEKKGLSTAENYIFKNILGKPDTFHKWLKRGKTLQKPFSSEGYIKNLPFSFSKHTNKRSLPTLADKPFRDIYKSLKKDIKNPRAKAAFYAGCVIDFCYPNIGRAVWETLQDNGIEMVFPEQQSCCGAPASYSGDRKTAVKLAKENIKALEDCDADYIVMACPTCIHVVKDEFPELLEGEKEWYQRARKISEKVKDYSELMVEFTDCKENDIIKDAAKITYHDSCHYKRELHLEDNPRKLFNNMKKVKLIEMDESDRCCGFGGSYTAKFPELSVEMLKRKIKNIEISGAEVVAMDCPGCIIQIRGGLDKINSNIKVKHTAEIVADSK